MYCGRGSGGLQAGYAFFECVAVGVLERQFRADAGSSIRAITRSRPNTETFLG